MVPSRSDFTQKEWQVIQTHRTPLQVQRFLTNLNYNREKDGPTCRSFRRVIKTDSAHCLEAAITAAVIMEQNGYPPLVVSLESQDLLDHVLFIFRKNDLYGAIARSRDLGLHGRKPIFRRIRDLVMSYFLPYIDKTGRITGYAVADLRDLGNYDWRLSERNVWKVEKYLQEVPHKSIQSSDRKYASWHRRYLAYKSQYPDRQADYYPNKQTWML